MGAICTRLPVQFDSITSETIANTSPVRTEEWVVKPRVSGHHWAGPEHRADTEDEVDAILQEPSVRLLPARVVALQSELYDPSDVHENYARWSRTRLSQTSVSERAGREVSDLSFRLITPRASGTKEMGRSVLVLDDRHKEGTAEAVYFVSQLRPRVAPGELWTDPDFPREVAMEGETGVLWKRPPEFCRRPVLFSDGSSRYDVGQGSAGTCWVLSILTALADKPEFLSQIIPEDAYWVGRDDYDGVFHCRLWRLGSWHDVYIDDHLPVSMETGNLWGAHSATDRDEMWVALMEKAFARFYGSYARVQGGCAGDAFVTLTGGVEEDLLLDKVAPPELFSRLDNALQAGAILACSVPPEHDGYFGLTGGHAYTITGMAQVPHRSHLVSLLRVRNPWGTGSGEWTGPWCDDSPEWRDVSSDVIRALSYRAARDGEFWISLSDFYSYFWRAFICNFTPDFDKDGAPDGLGRVWTILGQLSPERHTADPRLDITNKPWYIFKVAKHVSPGLNHLDGVETGKVPVVIQFLQESADKLLYVRLELYKMENRWTIDGDRHILLCDITKDKVFTGSSDLSYRYALPPGHYVVLPTYSKSCPPLSARNFCLRIFTTEITACSAAHWDRRTHIYINNFTPTYEDGHTSIQLSEICHFSGEWRHGFNSGGQACRGHYHTNPQVTMQIAGEGDALVCICLCQEQGPSVIPMGVDLFKITSPGLKLPVNRKSLKGRCALQRCATTLSGSFLFLRAPEAVGYYSLPAGRYVIVLFSDDVTDENCFVVTLAATRKISCRFYQGR